MSLFHVSFVLSLLIIVLIIILHQQSKKTAWLKYFYLILSLNKPTDLIDSDSFGVGLPQPLDFELPVLCMHRKHSREHRRNTKYGTHEIYKLQLLPLQNNAGHPQTGLRTERPSKSFNENNHSILNAHELKRIYFLNFLRQRQIPHGENNDTAVVRMSDEYSNS